MLSRRDLLEATIHSLIADEARAILYHNQYHYLVRLKCDHNAILKYLLDTKQKERKEMNDGYKINLTRFDITWPEPKKTDQKAGEAPVKQ